MSYFMPHLPSSWHVDETIKSEEDRLVVIRFGTANVRIVLYDPCAVMFFYRNKHIMIDLGSGNNNKMRKLAMDNKQEVCAPFVQHTVFTDAYYSTRYRY
ncbi:hypothetical protein B0H16DRAFT_1665660 [Mycena metata]|uniref:Uncharacterized protein n=1 Tax=Mycena metata TaxID=1033252 RepID=A0AAD7HSG7_9AGAR|nr:hypothetical protein B0H16DRAFT_1665660 [Mycena metata]